jgi:hypothetical protein
MYGFHAAMRVELADDWFDPASNIKSKKPTARVGFLLLWLGD